MLDTSGGLGTCSDALTLGADGRSFSTSVYDVYPIPSSDISSFGGCGGRLKTRNPDRFVAGPEAELEMITRSSVAKQMLVQ